jgi:arabinofuranan 3-O-arabinosyltransferase
VRLAVRTPAWLVLGESYSPAWRASCRDRSGRDHDLGAPEPIDGFANGWRVGPWCAAARFSFGPQRAALAGYLVSALGALVLVALLVLSALQSRAHNKPEAFPVGSGPAPPDPARRLGWRGALLAGVAVGLAAGFVFALRAGVVLGPATVLALRLGVRARTLLAVTAVLVAGIPVAYLLFPGEQGAREAFRFPEHHLAAHWLAVAALVCLAAGCALDAHARRGPGPPLSSRRDG